MKTKLGTPGHLDGWEIEYMWNDVSLTSMAEKQKRYEKLGEDMISVENHPNPFNENTTFKINLKTACRVSLHIYNINGQQMRNLS